MDGALEGDRATPAIAVHAHQTLIDAGWTVETISLRAQKIAYCLGCFECWVKTPGLCRIDDDGRTVTAAMLASDLVIYLTPLTYGGYSSELKKAIGSQHLSDLAFLYAHRRRGAPQAAL
ncbi:MAG: flavodoxin family protein [Anaerolineales bacterium]|nr:flavodoxin family protein [Anaerolineales bacterium]